MALERSVPHTSPASELNIVGGFTWPKLMTGTPLKNLRGPEFKALLRTLPFGKRLPSAVYVHREALAAASGPISEVVSEIIQVHEIGAQFNIIKFHLDTPKITFLEYPQFFEDPHPTLAHSILVDLGSGKQRAFDYTSNSNPPILHRKETFLLQDDPRASKFAALTAAEEAEGLYEDTTTIGFKLNWEKLLAAKCLGYSGESLVRISSPRNDATAPVPSIDRHKTALTRFDFSKPIKTVFEHGLLRQNSTIFDYGCGPGSDVAGLRSMGYEGDGWDPGFRPESQKKPSEVVNLGYVLNVVEEPAERVETLIKAWALTQRLLVVSALIRETVSVERATAFGDGIVTNRNTFQKYFDQHELQTYIEDALEQPATPVALGIFYVFRDPADLQAFLLSRTRRVFSWESLGLKADFGVPRPSRRQSAYELNKDLLEDFWNCVFQLGRLPLPEEYAKYAELGEQVGSGKRALRMLFQHGREEGFKQAQTLRKADTLVYLASTNLRRRVPFKHQPPSIRADIKAFFGDYKRGLNAGLELLFASGDTDELAIACEETKIGWQDEQALYIHVSLLKDLPPVLRAYVACAETLYGDASQADLIKLHKSSGKVTFLAYDDFTRPLPQLRLRIKVNLRSRWVQIFDHAADEQLLCFKERFLSPDSEGRAQMEKVSAALSSLGVPSKDFIGPTKRQMLELLKADNATANLLGLI